MSTRSLHFEALGEPAPQGSMQAFVQGGRAVVTHAKPQKLQDWRRAIGWAAREAVTLDALAPFQGPVGVSATFRVSRPRSVSEGRRPHPSVRPDVDKLLRALLDAITGIVIKDDAQVCRLDVQKVYALESEAPGVVVEVRELI